MTFNITAKFTLLDENGNKVNDTEIGCAIDDSDFEYSIIEKYEFLREELSMKSGLTVVDFIGENKMTDTEYDKFKELKNIIIKHMEKKEFSKPIIVIADNHNVKNRLEEVFKYDMQELSKYDERTLFQMKNPDLKVFKICTSVEYENLHQLLKDNSIKI